MSSGEWGNGEEEKREAGARNRPGEALNGDGRSGDIRKSADSSEEDNEAVDPLSSSDDSSVAVDLSVAGEAAAELGDGELEAGRVGDECGRMKDEARSSSPLSSNIDHMSAAT